MTEPMTIQKAVNTFMSNVDRNVTVSGQVVDFHQHSVSGHCYFGICDRECVVSCVVFRERYLQSGLRLADGDWCNVTGNWDFYSPKGMLRIVVEQLRPTTLGFTDKECKELWRNQLELRPKRPIPNSITRIGLVTSPDSAAVQDFCTTIQSHAPHISVFLHACTVQTGPPQTRAAGIESVIAALESAANNKVDIIVICRGGGSRGDLSLFDERKICDKIVYSPIPVICAIGHERDNLLCELAADLRASTPTAAALSCIRSDRQDAKRFRKSIDSNHSYQ